MSSSDSDEENIIKYGTPLEPYDEDEIPSKRKFQPPTDQYAVDDHGRRRFHGAFTGGFSAGYGNSVGTPEGWTPASFKSSRTEKAEISNQRPEDFMDDEDRGEFGIAPQRLETNSEFSGHKRPRQRYHDGPIPGEPVLEQLVRAVHETAAVRLLRRMGWRPGTDVGARTRRRPERRVYGCYVPPEMRSEAPESGSDSSDSEFEYEALFADDAACSTAARKGDRFGLGYSGLSRHSVLGGLGALGEDEPRSHLLMRDKGKRVSIRGQAFGVGALEADDDDVYAADDPARYDFALGPPPPDDRTARARTGNKGGGGGGGGGGAGVLEGFVRGARPEPAAARRAPPAPPRDYRPAPARATRFAPSDAPQRDQGLGRHELSPAARGALLGETPLSQRETTARPPPALAAPVKVVDLTGVGAAPAAGGEDFIPLGGGGGVAPARVFRPFAADPAKQARYERYLGGAADEAGAGSAAGERDGAGAVSAWERDRERREFEQAAKLYRPLTGAMSDRFTHAALPDDASPLAAVAPSAARAADPAQADAARAGVYGARTRTAAPWRPEPLVCKRFNVPDPGVPRSEPVRADKPNVSYSIFSYLEGSVHDRESFAREQSKFSGSKSWTQAPAPAAPAVPPPAPSSGRAAEGTREHGEPPRRMTVAELFLRESEKALETAEKVEDTIEKFDKMDLYKSIFLSDSEPEEEGKAPDVQEKPANTERNTSPPRGIFAGVDFDELNSWRRSEPPARQPPSAAPRPTDDKVVAAGDDDAVYGPRIPDNLRPGGAGGARPQLQPGKEESSGSDSWVDADEARKKQRSKKHKKHKSKHKKKHKKKDK